MTDRLHFIDTMLPIANDEEQRSGIKPLITITQSAHESNWGQSQLTVEANNLFGFTGDSWAQEGKPVIRLPTREWVPPKKDPVQYTVLEHGHWITVDRPFRAYKSWAESVRDWGALMQRPRYIEAYAAAQKGDIDVFASAVLLGGYATDPDYDLGLIRVATLVKQLKPDV